MMDPRTIQALSDEAARKARRGGQLPYGFFDEAEVDRVEASGRAPLPFLGSYVPRGYKLVDQLFVDSSGFGCEDEPALTQGQFFARVREHVRDGNRYFYAVTEAGQFQVYVGVYEQRAVRRASKVPHVKVPSIG